MAQNRFYSSSAPPTTLTSTVGSSGAIQVASIAGLPNSYPFTLLIDWGLSTQEAVSVTTAPSGTGPYTLTVTRGIDGTTAQGHNAGAIVVHGVTAEDYNEPQVHIATGTSGSGYPNVIHGLTNGSSVVGTLDTQTLSNKTLTATSFTGDTSIINGDGSNPILLVQNTTAAPTASIVRVIAAAAGDTSFGIRVATDTVNRLHIDSNGQHKWGPGGSTAQDTDLYRGGVGVLQTDNTFQSTALVVSAGSSVGNIVQITNTVSTPTNALTTYTANAAADKTLAVKVNGDTVPRLLLDSNGKFSWGPGSSSAADTDLYRQGIGVLTTDNTLTSLAGLQVGSNAPSFGSGTGGILGVTNASVNPSTGPANGLAVFAAGGLLEYINQNGLSQIITGSQAAGSVTLSNSTTETSIAFLNVPSNDPITGATYQIRGMGVVSTTGTPNLTWKTRWGGTSGTTLNTTGTIAQGSTITTLPFYFSILVMFMSSTTCVASQTVNYFTSAGSVPTVNYQQTASLQTVTTNANEQLALTATWSAASASNTLTTWYSAERLS